MDFQKFYDGKAFDVYKYLGAHPEKDGGVTFRTFALNADKVAVLGEFNGWTDTFMSDRERKGFFEITIPEAKVGQMYKYAVYSKLGRIEHCDPYGFGMELRPNFASIVRNLDEYYFSDEKWMKERTLNYDKPLNIYEMHIGSWKRNDADPNGWYKYDEIADELKVTLMDGSFHPVDSDQLSFDICAQMAFKSACAKAKPVLMEPIMKVEVVTPEESMGDVIGDLNKRRGQVEGMDTARTGARVIKAKVPLSEMFGYVTALRTITSGRATSSMEFSHYDAVSSTIAKTVLTEVGGRVDLV